jgi:cell division transport system permease protein
LEKFAEKARKIEGVSYVTYPQSFIEEMHSTLDIMQFIMIVFGGALLVVSFVLLNNTVRLAVYSQRELINTLKAVGATKWFIMKPFIGRSALQGFAAGILSALMLIGTLYGVEYAVQGLNIVPDYTYLGIIAAAMTLIGVVVAMVCTLPIVSRFVNMKSNTIHLC